MKYEVRLHTDHAHITGTQDDVHTYIRVDGPAFRAVAEATAFALNALSEGDSLVRCRVVVSGVRYDGPTEGI